MKKSILLGALLAALTLAFAGKASATIGWGYENWVDNVNNGTNLPPADGQVDEWGTFQLSLTVGTIPGESTAVGNIDNGQPWGKSYYVTGLSTTDATTQYNYLYVELFDIQGGFKLGLSGPSDADFFLASNGANLVASAGPTGAPPTSDSIFLPGQFVFDISGWNPTPAANTVVQLIGEGDPLIANQGFEIRRVFFTNNLEDTGLSPVPETSSWLMLTIGLVGVVGLVRSKLKK
jgi:hypothetical protein